MQVAAKTNIFSCFYFRVKRQEPGGGCAGSKIKWQKANLQETSRPIIWLPVALCLSPVLFTTSHIPPGDSTGVHCRKITGVLHELAGHHHRTGFELLKTGIEDEVLAR